jgi:hypothetical protein
VELRPHQWRISTFNLVDFQFDPSNYRKQGAKPVWHHFLSKRILMNRSSLLTEKSKRQIYLAGSNAPEKSERVTKYHRANTDVPEQLSFNKII